MSVGLALLLVIGLLLGGAAVGDLVARSKGRRIRIDPGELREARRATRASLRQGRLNSPTGPSRLRRRRGGPPEL